MAGEFPQVHGKPTPKVGLTRPAFPTQAADEVTLCEEVAYAILANGAVDLKLPAFGTPHPRSPEHRLVAVACLGGNEGKLWYRLTFSKLPGHVLPGGLVNTQTWGAPAVVTRQNVLAGTAPATGIGVLMSDVQPQDAQVAVATSTSVTWPTLTTTRINERGDAETVVEAKVAPGTALPAFGFTTVSINQQAETVDRATLSVATVGGYSTLTDHEGTASNRSLLHFIAGAHKTTTHDIVAPGTAADVGLQVVESSVRARNVAQSEKTTTTVESWPELNSSAVDPEAHGATSTTVSTVVASGSTPPAGGLNVLESRVVDTDGTHAIQVYKTLTDPNGWPTLVQYSVDEQTAIAVKVQKTVVDATTITDGMAGCQSDGWYVEYKPLDKFKSIQIASQVVTASLPAPIVYYGSRPLSVPDTLLAISPVWDNSSNSGAGTANGTTAAAQASASQHADGELLITIQHGFRGEAVARFTKTFLTAPPGETAIPAPTKILPSVGTAVIVGKGQQSDCKASVNDNETSSSYSCGSEIRSKVTRIGPVLTAGWDNVTLGPYEPSAVTASVSGGSADISASAQGQAYATIDIPASTPTSLTSGTWILDEVKVEQWRFGIWVMYTVEVQIP